MWDEKPHRHPSSPSPTPSCPCCSIERSSKKFRLQKQVNGRKFNRFLFMFLRLCTREQDRKALRGRVSASIILIYTLRKNETLRRSKWWQRRKNKFQLKFIIAFISLKRICANGCLSMDFKFFNEWSNL